MIRDNPYPRDNPRTGAFLHIKDCAYQVLAMLQERELAHSDRWVPAEELERYLGLSFPAQLKSVPGAGEKVSLLPPLLRFLEDRARLEARFEGEKAWYRSLPLYEHYATSRRNWLDKARAARNLLDKVFFAVHFNNQTGTYHGCEIDPAALAPHESVATLNDAIERAQSLHALNAYVGSAFHKYEGESLTFDQAVAKLKREHPGFGQEAYDIAISESIRGMR